MDFLSPMFFVCPVALLWKLLFVTAGTTARQQKSSAKKCEYWEIHLIIFFLLHLMGFCVLLYRSMLLFCCCWCYWWWRYFGVCLNWIAVCTIGSNKCTLGVEINTFYRNSEWIRTEQKAGDYLGFRVELFGFPDSGWKMKSFYIEISPISTLKRHNIEHIESAL